MILEENQPRSRRIPFVPEAPEAQRGVPINAFTTVEKRRLSAA